MFADPVQKSAAYSEQNNESVFYRQVVAIAEAKYWERPLSKVSSNDQRDYYKNTNPSFQIASYLIGTGVNWGILTNGREWRLYYRLASSTATEFYPIDLVELLESDDLARFKYFWLFFRREAFEADSQGKNFLERVREGSATYATRVGNELKSLVFEQIFSQLAGGFVAQITQPGQAVKASLVYEATLSFLYKLLFLFYAEARNLLPMDRDYRSYSLITLAQEIAIKIDQKRAFSSKSFIYQKLIELFKTIDQGDTSLGVPRYNGGLFHFEGSLSSNQPNHFLLSYQLSDTILAPVIDKLARFEGQAIDYSFLGVRQLGSIYEGLLEYRLIIDDAETGQVHLENDKGDRKASGSYYTPDYIVKYIVSHTLKPILTEREQQFKVLMGEIEQLQQQRNNKKLSLETLNSLSKTLAVLERQAQTILLDIKVCDPAMGSGHFLVEAVDFLTDELIQILNRYPDYNPILKMLDQMRQSIIDNLRSQGIQLDPSRLEPTQLLQRVVMKRCIYGVDLNSMAVELAKVSLWLHSFTIGAPLSFLDHHLRCGNSLIGTTAREAELAMSQEKNGNTVQFNLLTGPFVGLLRAAEIMRGVSVLSDATFAEVEQSERLFKQFDAAAKPFKQLLDIYVSQFFGVKQAKNLLERLGTALINPDLASMKEADLTVLEDSHRLYEEKHFFHWDLEFPEVFVDLENANWAENPGFDAVISNPPYVDIKGLEKGMVDYLFERYSNMQLRINIFAAFLESCFPPITSKLGKCGFIIPSSFLTQVSYSKIRQSILKNKWIKSIVRLPNELFGEKMGEVKVDTCLILIYPQPSNESNVLTTDILIYDSFERIDAISSDSASSYLNIEQGNWLNSNDFTITIVNQSEFSLTRKIEDCSNDLQNYCEFCLGITPYDKYRGHTDEEIKKQIFHATTKIDSTYKKLLVSGDVKRYEVQWNGEKWIKYGTWLAASRESRFFKDERILVQQIIDWSSLRIFVSYTNEELYNTQNQFNLLAHEGINLKFILSILASQLISFYHRKTFLDAALQRFQKVLIKDAKLLPIRKINFTTKSDRRQRGLENLINLYQTYQTNFDLVPILSQCQQHLNQQPEEADIIHDFLAYLAEQMIALNQQKQTEIKGFLEWLESLIGCPIANLKNKSKIQNYLGDYSKQMTLDPALDLDGLISILNQNKKLIKIDPSSRQDHTRIKTEYQASLNILIPLKTQLKNCDRLIDEIVYQLYGLTTEEKAIIENSLAK
ncbi:MAG: N-6 DNA methylase [Woronichinia naegeliana WA131]|uniref:site-specific DNA-methyltransferase (adenine-specific) n=1 Tax=Woronichinia naegeliana WA131 TaxID=2824559 RepID=A0A977PU95_9CYAN|nr:MAG: N-6 DNA methylase [Woronichinia naegeliana WA131]